MEYTGPNSLSAERYERLDNLTRILDDHVELHVKRYGDTEGLSDALNVVCALFANVVVNASKIDSEVFDKINGMLSYHIYLEGRSEGHRGVYNIG